MEFLLDSDKRNMDLDYLMNLVKPLSPYGVLVKSRMHPFTDVSALREEFDRQERFFSAFDQAEKKYFSLFHHRLSEVKDLRNSFKRAMEGFVLSDVELYEIKNFAHLVRSIADLASSMHLPTSPSTDIRVMKEVEELLDPEHSGVMTFYIYDSYSEELKKLRAEKSSAESEKKQLIQNKKKQIEELFSVRLAPDGTLSVNKEDERAVKMRESDLLSYSGENFRSIVFQLNKEGALRELELRIEKIKIGEEAEEERIRAELSKKLGYRYRELFRNAGAVGQLDFLLAKYLYARKIGAVKPIISEERVLTLNHAVYPKLQETLRKENLEFTPISLSLTEGTTVITGANMGGKSIVLKLIGLIQTLSQYGLYVPAESVTAGICQFIRTSIGDLQSTDTGLSTFGAEIHKVKEAVELSESPGMLLIDELARGTNPEEGRAISSAVAEYLQTKPMITVMTTHYDEVASKANKHYQVTGLSKVDLKKLGEQDGVEGKLTFINRHMDYRLFETDGTTEIPKDAVNIASIMGLQPEITKLAAEELKKR